MLMATMILKLCDKKNHTLVQNRWGIVEQCAKT